jgi:hypothetical protein
MPGPYINKVIVNGETKMDLTSDTVDAAHLLTGYTAHDKSGAPITGACAFDSNTQDANATAPEILTGKTAYAKGSKVTGTMPNNGSVSGEISTLKTPYTVPAGYHDGAGKVQISATEKAKIIPENIREGIAILGVEGNMSGTEDAKAQSKEVTPTFENQVVTPDTSSGYNYLAQVTVKAIPVSETEGDNGGLTLTIG